MLKGKKDIQEIASKYKTYIEEVNSFLEEIYLSDEIKKQHLIMINEMGIVYLYSFLETFNHDFFVTLFESQPFKLLGKKVKSKKDQEKLIMTFEDIITTVGHSDDKYLLELMAEKMYNEIYDYYNFDWKTFIKKLLDDYLELDFFKEYRNRNLNLDEIQNFRKYRNVILHKRSESENIQDKMTTLSLKELLINYINLLEELVIKKYFKSKDFDVFEL